MFSKTATTLALSLGLLSIASAVATPDPLMVSSSAPPNPQTDSSSAPPDEDNAWHITNFDASCANAECQHFLQIASNAALGKPAFSALCHGRHIPRHDRNLRSCNITFGENDGVTDVSMYMELRPRRPNMVSELLISVEFTNPVTGTITFDQASQNATYETWREFSTSGPYGEDAGNLDLYPEQV